ncbi:MAG: class I SAM-dependent methyltransferase [Candidatus Methanomethylicaceae archaeon]
MREVLSKLLRKSSTLYKTASKAYWKIAHIIIKNEGSTFYEKIWLLRHMKQRGDWGETNENSWVLSYWESKNHPHRSFLVEHILRFAPINSILEVGSNCGPNLYLLSRKLPSAHIIGVDINPVAVNEGNRLFEREGISNVRLICSNADKLENFNDKSFDIVFTDAVLIYIGPDKIKKVTKKMVRLARKAVILLEWHPFEDSNVEFLHRGKWVRDYRALFDSFGITRVEVEKIPDEVWPDPSWKKYGALITINLDF